MTLIRWIPRKDWDPLSWATGFRDEMDRLFERSLSPWGPRRSNLEEGSWGPAVDIVEDNDHIVVRANLPGMNQDDINLSILDDKLDISGEKKQESEVKEENCHRVERYYGAFHREIQLPVPVAADKVEASYKDGVLEVTLPKKEGTKAKKIDIKSS